jgi:hypothetical protein
MAQELQWTSAQEHEAVTHYVERINFFLERAGLQPEPSAVGRSSAV